ncbi:MAG: heme exporter protein CcmB [Dehalococcoidales bacterium]|jgi:heme exporter protein B|nr:heme exporter protein CcmB [Dehalococcoidales bacterium]MDD4230262.1 heme exporter protein CcmB [Dehalococcoidales bacterium]MDD4465446.1 heme exporter protein CcmB [Dehalococcoidales bacterium]MDD5402518.1 heme exporter protein CcmB [Dehalococcoidales bacterium]
MKELRDAFTIASKDVLTEIRTREVLSSVVIFAVLVIIIFNFAFGSSEQAAGLVAPGILWVTFAFTGILSLNRSFILEKEEDCIEGLMVAPLSREAVYLGKFFGNVFFIILIQLIVIPIFSLLFNISFFNLELLLITILATLGFASVGTLFAAMAVNTRARELVLPILFFPVITPVIIAAVNASAQVLDGQSFGAIAQWLGVIGAFDVIFIVASYLIFSFIIEE